MNHTASTRAPSWVLIALLSVSACQASPDASRSAATEFCESFEAGVKADSVGEAVSSIQYRGRPRDVEQFRFCVSLRQLDDGAGLQQAFSVAAQDLRGALSEEAISDGPPSDAVRGPLRTMGSLLETVNAAPTARP